MLDPTTFMERLADFLYGTEEEIMARPIEEVEEDLREAGIDTTEVVAKVKAMIDQAKRNMPL